MLSLLCIIVEIGMLTYETNRQFGLAFICVILVC